MVSENYVDFELWFEIMIVERVCEFLDNGFVYWYINYGCVFNFDLKNYLILWINFVKFFFYKFVLKIDKIIILINFIVLYYIIV